MESTETDPSGYIELKFGPRWKYIAVVRAFIQNFLAISFADAALADKIAMATSELLENAVKYAIGEETSVSVWLDQKDGNIAVSVSNKAAPDAIASLKTNWDSAMVGEPLAAYIRKMQEAATRNDSKSQLGLVRIRYETGADMTLDVQNDTVTIKLTHKNAVMEEK